MEEEKEANSREDTSKSGKSIDFRDPENRRFSRKPLGVLDKDTNKKNKLKVLIFLITLVLIMDAFALYLYNYEKSPNTNPISEDKCTDGTTYDSCSKEKPLFCYNGELLEKAFTCGCPKGYEVDFQNCKEI